METMPGPRYVQDGQFVIRYVAFCAIFYSTCTYYIRMSPKKRKKENISRQPCMQKRTPNATLLNIAAKIKCTKNRIIQHLMAMDDQQRSGHQKYKCYFLISKKKEQTICEGHAQ